MKKVAVTSLEDNTQYDIDVDRIRAVQHNAAGTSTYTFNNNQTITVSAADAVVIDSARGIQTQTGNGSINEAITIRTLSNEKGVERVRNELRGLGADTQARHSERLEAARRGKAFRPLFLVGVLANAQNAGVFLSNNPINFRIPDDGVSANIPIYGAMTDAHKTTALFNLVRRNGLPPGVSEESMFSQPAKAIYFMGDLNTGANRITVPDWFPFIEPERLYKDEWLNLILMGDGATPDMSACYVVFQSERIYPDDSDEGKLNPLELGQISAQIAGTEQALKVIQFAVDYTNINTYRDVQFPKLRGDHLLLGFASGKDAAGAQLVWSTVDVLEQDGTHWSNKPMPITALMSVPADVVDPNNYRLLRTPRLLRRGGNNLSMTFAKRVATGAAPAYPPNMAADTTGIVYALLLPV